MATDNGFDKRVDKIVRIIGASSISWEDAARNAVQEAALTIRDLDRAKVLETDVSIHDGEALYRVRLELSFRLDRLRTDAHGEAVEVRRYLIIANQTLASPQLHALVSDKTRQGPAEFHVVVPQIAPTVVQVDPSSGLINPSAHSWVETRAAVRQEAESRLATFRQAFADLGHDLSGEVILGDPVTAAQRVMARSSFDEIIVSTLPPGTSRWLKLDLPSRVGRAFSIPVTTIIEARVD